MTMTLENFAHRVKGLRLWPPPPISTLTSNCQRGRLSWPRLPGAEYG